MDSIVGIEVDVTATYGGIQVFFESRGGVVKVGQQDRIDYLVVFE